MDYEKIKQLMDDMGNSKLTSLDIEFPDGIHIKMEKKIEEKTIVESRVEIPNKDENVVKVEDVKKEMKKEMKKEEKDDNFKVVKSPIVGTFYIKPSPEADPYVEIGSKVKKGDVLCIVEAMKLMNEIESEFDGEIAEILVSDGEIVDYGKPLFKIK